MCTAFVAVCALDMLGRNNEARDADSEVIKRDGTISGPCETSGVALLRGLLGSAARLTYNEALTHHPRDLRTLINLGNALLETNELAFSRDLYERALEVDPQCHRRIKGSATCSAVSVNMALVEVHRRAGLKRYGIAL